VVHPFLEVHPLLVVHPFLVGQSLEGPFKVVGVVEGAVIHRDHPWNMFLQLYKIIHLNILEAYFNYIIFNQILIF
jgi:hypothetical protein